MFTLLRVGPRIGPCVDVSSRRNTRLRSYEAHLCARVARRLKNIWRHPNSPSVQLFGEPSSWSQPRSITYLHASSSYVSVRAHCACTLNYVPRPKGRARGLGTETSYTLPRISTSYVTFGIIRGFSSTSTVSTSSFVPQHATATCYSVSTKHVVEWPRVPKEDSKGQWQDTSHVERTWSLSIIAWMLHRKYQLHKWDSTPPFRRLYVYHIRRWRSPHVHLRDYNIARLFIHRN